MTGFADRVVLVTGGGTGIGKELATAFHSEGARVALASRGRPHLEETARSLGGDGPDGPSGRVMTVRVDVRRKESARAAAREVAGAWGRIDVLVNNAGVSGQNPLDGDEEEVDARWADIIDTNLNGMYWMTRASLPHMGEGGSILNISSVLGKFGVPGYTAYCASKHGVVGLTRALAAELAVRRITVNALCPGWVDTAMARQGMKESAARLGITEAEFEKKAMEQVPLGRFLRPAEIAPLALYMTSPAAESMTGQAVNLEGGATTW